MGSQENVLILHKQTSFAVFTVHDQNPENLLLGDLLLFDSSILLQDFSAHRRPVFPPSATDGYNLLYWMQHAAPQVASDNAGEPWTEINFWSALGGPSPWSGASGADLRISNLRGPNLGSITYSRP